MDWWWFLLIGIAIVLAVVLFMTMVHVVHDMTKPNDVRYSKWMTADDDANKEFHLSYKKMERAENVLA